MYADLGLHWHGTFRPRRRARDAFDSLVDLLGLIGHLEPRSRLPKAPRLRGSRLVALRRVPLELLEPLRCFFDGESDALLGDLFGRLLESRVARREPTEVQEAVRCLEAFYRRDVLRLQDALRSVGRSERFVKQHERDALFIEARLRDRE